MKKTEAMIEREECLHEKWREYDEDPRYAFLIGKGPFSLVAYIAIPPDHPMTDMDYYDILNIDGGPRVNGGLTFSNGNVFGWDYGHLHNWSTPSADIAEALRYFKEKEGRKDVRKE